MPSRIPLVFGAATIGAPGTVITRIHTLEESQKFIDRFTNAGYDQMDTSRIYGNGTSEEYIGKLDLHGARVDTKVFPVPPGNHAPEKLRATFQESLIALSPHKINIFYLHAADRSVPFEDTLREVDRIHKEGHFKEFGLSNFNSWEVAEVVGICKANDWVRPTVYQGRYNALERDIEIELIPCLRKFGIRFFAYSPLAAGLLTGRILTEEDLINKKGGRFDTEAIGKYANIAQGRYKGLVPAFVKLKETSDKYNLHVTEVAQRWLQHHSNLNPDDRVIIGASSLGQLDINLKETLSGPLPDEVLQEIQSFYSATSLKLVFAFTASVVHFQIRRNVCLVSTCECYSPSSRRTSRRAVSPIITQVYFDEVVTTRGRSYSSMSFEFLTQPRSPAILVRCSLARHNGGEALG